MTSEQHKALEAHISFWGALVMAIVVPDWVAREKGLQQTNQDKDTMDLFGSTA